MSRNDNDRAFYSMSEFSTVKRTSAKIASSMSNGRKQELGNLSVAL